MAPARKAAITQVIEGAYTLRSSQDGKGAGGRERKERTQTRPGGRSLVHAMPCHAIQGTAQDSHTLGNSLSFVFISIFIVLRVRL